ncbi:MAG TPA: choice-of-anchor D domain-containing protein, partial [Verrucomicrobiae bacterium]|nr:choice-of-anchor D domain-containing protein [Verrucomicrobiae bacterium]
MLLTNRFVLIGILAGVVSAINASAASTPLQIVQQAQTVFVIGMENHNFTQPSTTTSPQEILTNPAAPYINSLITPGNSNAVQVSYATRYFNAGVGVHPSESSYVWSEAGTDFGVHTDNDPTGASGNVFNTNHLTRQLTAAGIAWKNYQEDVQLTVSPTNSASGTSGTVINPYYGTGQYGYAVKHNPMAFFGDTQLQNVFTLTNLFRDLTNNSLGRYNWITPNLYNDQHTALTGGFTYHGTTYTSDQAGIAQGDNFLSIVIPKIMASSAYQNNGVIILWWDESEGGDTTNFTIPCIIISPLAKGNAYTSILEYSHSSDLRTLEEIFGLNFLTNAIPTAETRVSGSGYNQVTNVNDFSDLLHAVPQIHVQTSSANLTNNLGSVNLGTVNVGAMATNVFAVTNSGLGDLTLTTLSVSGANASEFTVSGLTLPATLATGDSTTFKVAFAPAANGTHSATLRVTNNDVVRNPFTIALIG